MKTILPNGMNICSQTQYETDYLYQEIFVEQSYLQHNIIIPEHAVVVDVGANIGLFSLFIMKHFNIDAIYAFEPIPDVYTKLQDNTKFYHHKIQCVNQALSNEIKQDIFHYYPQYSVISGLYTNPKRDAEIIFSGMASKDENTKQLIEKRLADCQTVTCQFNTLSNFIKTEYIAKINLLKIDVEGAELHVIQGINESDFAKIDQIVMEIHHHTLLHPIINKLQQHQFNIHVEKDKHLQEAEVYALYAIKYDHEICETHTPSSSISE